MVDRQPRTLNCSNKQEAGIKFQSSYIYMVDVSQLCVKGFLKVWRMDISI